jgi:type 2 lantibiotic biosynthesis protein LanM
VGVESWREEAGLRDDGLFERRLATDRIDIDSFRALLANADEPVLRDVGWIHLLQSIFHASDDESLSERRDLAEHALAFPFSTACWPFLLWAKLRYQEHWESLAVQHQHLPFTPQLLTRQFLQSLTEQLTECLGRTLTLELNVARLRGALFGSTPQDRFDSFVDQYIWHKNDIIKTLEEYPVLARLLATFTNNWVEATTEAVGRLCRDQKNIRSHFGLSLGSVTAVGAGASDAHRNGRSVLIFSFEAGERLVYKPKPLAVDQRFQELLRWLNANGVAPEFPILNILNRGHYGWEEFVEAAACTSTEQVRRFYLRQGGYLALLHVLAATDFHCENIVAAGEFPYLIDLETLFHHGDGAKSLVTAVQRANRLTASSVLGTGMLPSVLERKEGKAATDLSGLGGAEGQASLVKILHWEEVGTDSMRAVRRHGTIEGSDNRPELAEGPVDAKEYSEEFLQGFGEVYQLLAKNKEALVDMISGFRDDVVRQVLRPTYIYSLFLEGGLHPDFLRNGLDRDRFMDRLWAGLGAARGVEKTVPSEREDLLVGDIPYFYTTPGSCDLWDSRGKRIPQFFETDGLAEALKHCEALGEEDFELQKDFIRVALESGGRPHLRLQRPSSEVGRKQHIGRDAFLDAAVEIGDHLEDKAIWGEGRQSATWLEPSWLGNEQWQLGPADTGLYNGLSGIAFFLAYLAGISGQGRFKHLARAAANSLGEVAEYGPPERNVSAFRGRASSIYTLMHLSRLWDEPVLLERALEEARKVRDHVAADTALDLLDGPAGTAVVLLQLHEMTGARLPYDAALMCGDHLLAHASRMPEGLGWRIPLADKPLAGFSHGASGISWALAMLGRASGEERFVEASVAALRYERSLFEPAMNNWLDLRTADGAAGASFPVAWCNGAPGIGIARLLCLDLVPYEHFAEEIEAALDTTLHRGFGGTHCLCHGDFGNAELLLLAAEKLDDPRLMHEAHRVGGRALADARQRGRWLSGWSGSNDEALGLMIGLSGVGHGLLRLATDGRVPSPVYLAPHQGRP